MVDTKQMAKYIFEEYTNCYSEVDIEKLAKHLDEIKAEAVKEFAERLCDGRLSNDPVVIAVKVELKEMVGENK